MCTRAVEDPGPGGFDEFSHHGGIADGGRGEGEGGKGSGERPAEGGGGGGHGEDEGRSVGGPSHERLAGKFGGEVWRVAQTPHFGGDCGGAKEEL